MISRALALATVTIATACAAPDEPKERALLEPPAPGEGFQVKIETTAPARTEVWRCEVFYGIDVGDDRLVANVNRVHVKQSEYVHHADLMTFFYTGLTLPAGQHDCDTLYADNPELMEDGLFIFGSQESDTTLQLPEGTVAQVPTGIGFMYEIHYVNTSDEDVDIGSYLNAYVIPSDDVVETIWGGVNRDVDLAIPAHAVTTEWTRCTFTADVDVLFLSSHTHKRGKHAEIKLFDGTNSGDVIFTNDDWHAPQIMKMEPPLHRAAGTGFEYACTFDNKSDVDVTWGLSAEDEMCQIGYAFTPGDRDVECVTVASSDGLGIPE